MRNVWKVATVVVLLAIVAVIGSQLRRSSGGASSLYGGSLEPVVVADFPSLGAERWVNGAPLSLAAAHGRVVLIEAWHPT
jgi:hypothetical protein